MASQILINNNIHPVTIQNRVVARSKLLLQYRIKQNNIAVNISKIGAVIYDLLLQNRHFFLWKKIQTIGKKLSQFIFFLHF
jgi:hypothetical protein